MQAKENDIMDARGFLIIVLAQLLVLCFSALFTCSWILETSSDRVILLGIANEFYYNVGLHGMIWEIVVFFVISFFLRLSLYLYPRILLILSLILYTLSGTVITCHLSSVIICSEASYIFDESNIGEKSIASESTTTLHCDASSPSAIRGRSAIYISTPLILFSFLFAHMNNFISLHGLAFLEQSIIRSIIQNTVFILFIVCGCVCIIDDSVWDWKYAYTCLFTLGFTAYLNGVSTYILFSPNKGKDIWQTAALVYLQPLVLVEDSIKTCLTT